MKGHIGVNIGYVRHTIDWAHYFKISPGMIDEQSFQSLNQEIKSVQLRKKKTLKKKQPMMFV